LDLGNAHELGAQLLTLAEDIGEPTKLMVAHAGLGVIFLLSGEFAAARDHLDKASPRFNWGQCDFSGAFYPSFGAWALWVLGYPDQALNWDREALTLAQAQSRPGVIANALHLATVLHMFLRNPRLALERAEEANAIANEYGTPFELSYASFARGWALTQHGRLEEGIGEMRHALQKPSESGFATRPRWFVYLAEACARSEGPDVGLKLLAEGMALMERTGERMYEAELHRMRGELLLMQEAADLSEAENCFRAAIEVARHQSAKSLELRATIGLARLFAKQGRRNEARTMLAEIYGWFTEGFDTADLRDAKALLDELSQ